MKYKINIGSFYWNQIFRNREMMAQKTEWAAGDLSTVYFEGDISALLQEERKRILVIGSRDIDGEVKASVTEILRNIASLVPSKQADKAPIILSGLAVGTDTIVHKTALEMGLPTVAVLGNGLNTVYPHVNSDLAERIKHMPSCGLLTQFDDGIGPMATNFIDRTKTLVLMSDCVIVVCSKEKGMSIVAARFARDWGIPVYAIPGRPDDIRMKGNNRLIGEGLAEIIIDYGQFQDIMR